MAAEVEGRIKSEGRRTLTRILGDITQEAVALLLGVGRGRVGNWNTGLYSPDFDGRRRCKQKLGIPMDDWDPDPLSA